MKQIALLVFTFIWIHTPIQANECCGWEDKKLEEIKELIENCGNRYKTKLVIANLKAAEIESSFQYYHTAYIRMNNEMLITIQYPGAIDPYTTQYTIENKGGVIFRLSRPGSNSNFWCYEK